MLHQTRKWWRCNAFGVDSPIWKYINNDPTFDNFGSKVHNMRLVISLDNVNPFKLSNTNWSTWPMFILICNFKPWLVTKKFFISLCILILRKQSPSYANASIFIHPLLKQPLELWKGVAALHFSWHVGSRMFKLCAMLMWTISDLPAYGLTYDLCCKGYKGCPCCGPNIDSRMTKIQ